ncbi:MAG: hypothetical protein LBI13_05120 [Streptococcaceae bacterium]|nr:hypothetical protein [Streptococcaceae bacterium]
MKADKSNTNKRILLIIFFLHIILGGINVSFIISSYINNDKSNFYFFIILLSIAIPFFVMSILTEKSRNERQKELGLDNNEYTEKNSINSREKLLWIRCVQLCGINSLFILPMQGSWEFTYWLSLIVIIIILLIWSYERVFGIKFKV